MNHQGRQNYPQQDPTPFNETFKEEWIRNGINMEAVTFTEKLGKFVSENKLTTSQIRNVFGEIKRIQIKGYESEVSSFYLLKPKFAYAAKRHEGKGIQTLKKVFDYAHSIVKDEKTYQNFVNFFESILAYHKAHGGKD